MKGMIFMDFYTKKWKDYIYKNWAGLLGQRYNVSYVQNIYDGIYSDFLLKSKLDDFIYLKKKYISEYENMEKMFSKYQKIELLDQFAEKEMLCKRIDNFIEKNKNKIENIMSFLTDKGININDLNIDDVSFHLLALNIIDLKTKKFYKTLIKKYKEFLDKENLSEQDYVKNIMDIDLIENDVFKVLITYKEYLSTRNNLYNYELIDSLSFHDHYITNYIVNKDKIIIELEYEYNRKIVFEIDNAEIDAYIEDELQNKVENIDHNVTGDGCDVQWISYGNYEDIPFYLEIHYVKFFDEGKTPKDIVIKYFSNNININKIIANENIEKYIKSYDLYRKNIEGLKNIVSEEVFALLSTQNFNILEFYYVFNYELGNDLRFNYISFLPPKNRSPFSLIFKDAVIDTYKDNEHINVKKFSMLIENKFNNMKIENDNMCKKEKENYIRNCKSKNIDCNDKKIKEIEEHYSYVYGPFKYSFKEVNGKVLVDILIIDDLKINIVCSDILFESQDNNLLSNEVVYLY